VLAGVIGSAGGGGGRRAFVDGTGTPVVLPTAIRRVVATDPEVGALLLALGAPVVGCAGAVAEVEVVGPPRAPDPKAVAALRPDVIVSGAVDGRHDLAGARLAELLRTVAPVVAVQLSRQEDAAADLRALLGRVIGGEPAATEPVSDRRVGAPIRSV
jgi:ABC-type Fe3+-hydroxamate transport system substrate-binding protein